MNNTKLTRLIFCTAWLFLSAIGILGQTVPPQNLKWHNISNLTIEGKAWTDTKEPYDRLPARAEAKVRPQIWNLQKNSAGISVRFVTDSPEIFVRWKLRNERLALSNMPATSVSSPDLYIKENGKWLWAGVGRADKFPINEQKLIGNMERKSREYLLYLPLYNGVESVEIGLPEGVSIAAAQPFPATVKPILFYGTSIVQGASAGRAGMAYPAVLSRRLGLPVINLGFSGNCKMEPELAEFISEIEASVYFIDCLPNLTSGTEVEEKAPKFLSLLRAKRPNTPIILVENIRYPDTFVETKKREVFLSKNGGLQNVYKNLMKSGAKNIYYIPSDGLIGTDGEATIDGVHPTDLGFMRMVENFEPVLRRVLRLPASSKNKK